MKVLLLGSNYLAGLVFTRLCGFNDMEVTVMSNKDPLGIQNQNNDVYRIIRRYCKGISYRDTYNSSKTYGDPKRNLKLNFIFKDYINQPVELKNYDIIINCAAIYDTLYAQANPRETLNVNVHGLYNIINGITSNADRNPLFIQMSSINVYGVAQKGDGEITEDTPPNPQDLLGISLLTQENMVKGLLPPLDVDYIILRLGNLTGDFTPVHSLTNSTVTALLNQDKEFTVDNFANSIELLDAVDLGNLIDSLVQMYKDNKIEDIKNEIYNVKCDETEPKTVQTIVESIFETASYMPTITEEHYKQMGLRDYSGNIKLKAPKLKLGLATYPVNFQGRRISNTKMIEKLKHRSLKPLIHSLLPQTAHYLMNYVMGDLTDNQRAIYAKMLWLPSVPKPSTLNQEVNEDVRKVVEEVNDQIEKSLS